MGFLNYEILTKHLPSLVPISIPTIIQQKEDSVAVTSAVLRTENRGPNLDFHVHFLGQVREVDHFHLLPFGISFWRSLLKAFCIFKKFEILTLL